MSDSLYPLALAVAARLKAQGAGVAVHYGRDRFNESPGAPICELRRDYDGQDTFGPPIAAGGYSALGTANSLVQRAVGNVAIAAKARFSGQSSKAGAGEHDHVGVVEAAVDAVYAALVVIGNQGRIPIGLAAKGKFIAPEDGVIAIGARYELTFAFSRAVLETIGQLMPLPQTPDVSVYVDRGDVDPELNCGTGA